MRWDRIRPKGWSAQYRAWSFTPQSTNAYWNPGQIIRFQMNVTEGVMDPYRSYLVFDVSVAPNMNVGCLQIDNSASGFFSQLVGTSNNREVERILEYDTLAAYLTDIGYSEVTSKNREQEGYGIGKPVVTEGIFNGKTGGLKQTAVNWAGNPSYEVVSEWGSDNYSPTKNYIAAPVFYSYIQLQAGTITLSPNLLPNIPGQNSSHLSTCNQYMNTNVTSQSWVPSNSGLYSNIRAEYSTVLADNKYPDGAGTILRGGYQMVVGSTLNTPNSTAYGINFNPNAVHTFNWQDKSEATIVTPNQAAFHGYEVPYSPFTAAGCFEPSISSTVPTCQMQNGNLLPTKVPVQVKRFTVPVLSGIMGVLIPPASYQLIPMLALQNYMMEFTVSPFAMFSSGYPDRNEWDAQGMTVPIPRTYRIQQIEYVCKIYNFTDNAMREYMMNSLVRGIDMVGESYLLAAQYQLPNGSYVRGSFQINSTVYSLSEVICLFLANDYEQYPFCRKQFRLSNNITSMQLKYNAEFFPPQPIVGNAGNPEVLDSTMDCTPFYMQLIESNNELFNITSSGMRVNRINFCINNRIYDPTNTATMLPQQLLSNNGIDNWQPSWQINGDTAMGMPFFHENRYVGRAAFVYSFEQPHSKEFVQGIDASSARPFEVVFNSQPTGYFERDETLYIFLRYNQIVRYTDKGVFVLSK